jgi:integrase/recombinase XerD
MTALASHLAAFLREHLPHERMASPHTCATYAYSFQLLVCFAARRLNVKPCQLEIEQLDAPLVLAFLKHIESERHNSARTRNARLAAVNSLFRFLEYRLPSCLDQSRRIHAIPMKKTDEALIGYLTREEMQALINAPDPRTKFGIRDRAMLHLAFAAGLRVSELISLRLDHLDGLACSSIHVMGKGRRERVLPLWKDTARALRAWLAIRPRDGCPELFPNNCWPCHDALRIRAHPGQARCHGSASAAVDRQKARHAARPSPQLRNAYAASDTRRSQGLALARPC